jgi:hypothetical protein
MRLFEKFYKEINSEIEKSMAQNLEIFVKNFDYFALTIKKPTKLKTTNLMTKEGIFKIRSDCDGEEGGGGSLYLLLPL